MQNQITFTIGIPAFKSKFLKECIDSILSQTYKHFEIIIVNDSSPHPVENIVKEFTDERIRYYVNDYNIGAENVVENWNKCLNFAEGQFFILMGDDDILDIDYLNEFVLLIEKYPTLDVYHCRTMLIDENSRSLSLVPSWPEHESVYDSIWHRLNGHRTQFISDFVYRTSTLIKNGGFVNLPLAWGSDDLSAFVAAGLKGTAHINKPVFRYRHNQYNISSTGSYDLKMKAIMLQDSWFTDFLKKDPVVLEDRVLVNDIRKNLKKYIQRKKVYTLSMSFESAFIKNIVKWLINKKKYQLSMLEISYAVFESIKKKRLKRNYHHE